MPQKPIAPYANPLITHAPHNPIADGCVMWSICPHATDATWRRPMTSETAKAIAAAFVAGRDKAQSYKPGALFMGASPEALAHG